MADASQIRHILNILKFNNMKYINIRTITAEELRQLSLADLVAICKALDNGNGDWLDVTADEYDYILETATNLITEYQS